MNKLVTKYFALTIVFLLSFCLGLNGLFPATAQARLFLSDDPDGGGAGDPNDEQDFDDGTAGGDFDDDYEDGYWGVPDGSNEVPMISPEGYLLLLPNWDLTAPTIRIYILKEIIPPLGENDAR